MAEKTECMKQLVEMAVACGRKRKSLQTGYLHHFYGGMENEPQLSIPIVENFLYAYALLRTKTIENVNEAKGLLDGLIHFQNSQSRDFAFGNFPIYLHDYPICKDQFTGLHVAFVVSSILKDFHHVLPKELNTRLEKLLSLSIDHALSLKSKPLSYLIEIKMAVLSVTAGKILKNDEMEKNGLSTLETLSEITEDASWFCPESLGEIAVALLFVYPALSASPFAHIWEHLTKCWHKETGSYIGPILKEWQYAEEPQVTLYDYLMGYLSGSFSTRAKKDHLIQLKSVLIPPCDDGFKDLKLPETFTGDYQGAKWTIYNAGRYAYSCIDEGFCEVNQIYAKGFHPFRLLWGDSSRVHTFVCQDGNAKRVKFHPAEAQISIDYELGNLIEFEDRENSREIAFFVDVQDGMGFTVEGEKSSTFKPGELISLQFPQLHLQMIFDAGSEKGIFLGHRMLGNRPAQIAAKGSMRFNAYDWQIFLRTVRRQEECNVKVSLKIL